MNERFIMDYEMFEAALYSVGLIDWDYLSDKGREYYNNFTPEQLAVIRKTANID
jgi:hypothetical protein